MRIRLPNNCKNCAFLLSTLLIIACQPPAPIDNQQPSEKKAQADSPIIFNDDSVTMASDYILSIKPSRYQPSLGLQGVIEPTKQSRFVAAHDIIVQKILVSEGQWVEEDTPLLIVKRQLSADTVGKTSASTTNNEQETKVATSTAEPPINTEQEHEISGNNEKSDNNVALTEEDLANNDETDQTIDSNTDRQNISDDQDTAIVEQAIPTNLPAQSIVVQASFSGRVDKLHVKNAQPVAARTPLLRVSDDKNLRFVATLPLKMKPQLSVGQTVNFTAKNSSEKFVGQIGKLATSNQPGKLRVYVHVVKNEASRDKLKPDMLVSGRVDYGQIEVGTIVPEYGIHDADLSVLKKPPYQSLVPITANVWIIKQDQRLTRLPVEVIKYDPSTEQYLVAGISNDSLICLADLPIKSVGKKVIVS
ncbi:HlyD family efflux transporter periplasmic adaptor subunit [Psychrobacter sp. Cmf 22.2]|uniref:HlyD family efflux transporter periplasmic adaptor subunit n=1 Tax=Psychrobacter sp. Cmf 22.2 TaxID=1926478 RepID=UPI001179A538|nr:HlyD family efflux transporter periplasmic adaptor subunit [Psychrobacter sp. Cmf 22.2]